MLHHLQADKFSRIIIRTQILIHSLAVSLLLYYRASLLFISTTTTTTTSMPAPPPTIPCLLLFFAELHLFLQWLAEQAYHWRPVSRSLFVENLPRELEEKEKVLPAIDVLICTADPKKEPTVQVMNTLISAMALDYPSDSLHVYLSDDGGTEVTLRAMKEAWSFATWWVPFCRKYGVKTICPEAYFEEEGEEIEEEIKMPMNVTGDSVKFKQDKLQIKEKYEGFKERVLNNLMRSPRVADYHEKEKNTLRDHPPVVEVINESCTSEAATFNAGHVTDIPLLVYVAREKRPSYPHHFKAGALNVLLRVSGLMSNSPIVLVLDCDMYCNDPTSAKRAICFYMDPKISPTLAFVQFPQRFCNLSESDIYDSGLNLVFKVLWKGLDGLQGPILSGTGFYIKRKALYDNSMKGLDNFVELRSSFGSSNEFVKTLGREHKHDNIAASRNPSLALQEEAQFLASCKYEEQTKWGEEVGFMYHSVVEDALTGFILHIEGWTSVYYDPPRDQFLGTAVTSLNDTLIQGTRWSAGLVEVCLSRFCPLIYKLSSPMMLLQRVCYAWLDLVPLIFLPVWCFATIPQLFLLHGIPLYPKVSSSFFPVLVFIFTSSLLRNLYEVLMMRGDTFVVWSSHWRMWMIKALTSHTYGSLDVIMKNFGLKEVSFIPTNKVMDDEQVKRYQQGVYDFQTSNMFLVPMCMAVILNMACFMGGVIRMMICGNWDEMVAQVLLSGFILVMSWPIIEGMVLRNDKGRVPLLAIIKSVLVSMLLLFGSFILLQHYLP